MISVIIPVRNEEGCIESTLGQLKNSSSPVQKEIIVVDGGSTDKTVELSRPHARVIQTATGRSRQLNTGAEQANGDILFFAHADMKVPDGALHEIHNRIEKGYDGGGFSNKFDRHNSKIKKLGHLMNLRFFNRKESSDKGVFFGDNGIFVKKSVFQSLGGFKNIPIMEDYDFSLKMKKSYRVIQIKKPQLILSARRHEKSGFLKTRLQWVLIKRLYQLGFSPFWLAKLYREIR